MPDRLPSLIVLAGFWVPPMVAGWMAAGSFQRRPKTERARLRYATLTAFVLGYVAIWFVYNATRMPPYIPGSTRDPTFAPPRALAWLAVVAAGVVLPGSVFACALAFRRRSRMLRHTSARHASA